MARLIFLNPPLLSQEQSVMRHQDVSQTLRYDGWIFQPVNIVQAGGYIFFSEDKSSSSDGLGESRGCGPRCPELII